MNDPSRLQELFYLYQQRRCSAAEVEELIKLLQEADAEESLSGPMLDCWQQLKDHAAEYPVDWDAMYHRISRSEERCAGVGGAPKYSSSSVSSAPSPTSLLTAKLARSK